MNFTLQATRTRCLSERIKILRFIKRKLVFNSSIGSAPEYRFPASRVAMYASDLDFRRQQIQRAAARRTSGRCFGQRATVHSAGQQSPHLFAPDSPEDLTARTAELVIISATVDKSKTKTANLFLSTRRTSCICDIFFF